MSFLIKEGKIQIVTLQDSFHLTYLPSYQLDHLQTLYEELQLASVEAGRYPEEDILMFAHRTKYFGIIIGKQSQSTEESVASGSPTRKNCRKELSVGCPVFISMVSSSLLQTGQSLKKVDDNDLKNHVNDDLYSMLNSSKNDPQDTGTQEWDDFIWRGLPSIEVLEDAPRYVQENPVQILAQSSYGILGFVFLIPIQEVCFPDAFTAAEEMVVGIILSEDHRGFGYAKEALQLVLEVGFDSFKCRQLRANILDTYCKDQLVNLFTQTHFKHVGRRRRCYYSVLEQEWKDVTSFAIRDTEYYANRSYPQRAAPATLLVWNEVRHSDPFHLQRTSSMETLRGSSVSVGTTGASQSDDEESALESDGWSSPVVVGKGKRKIWDTDEVSTSDGWSSPVFIGKGKRKLGDESPASTRPGSPCSSERSSGSRIAVGHKLRKLATDSVGATNSDDDDYGSLLSFPSPPPEVPPSPVFSTFSSADSDASSNWSAQTSSDWALLESASGSER
ncbi:hypothetical protein D9758_009257 [Tetrapyrgos nigripes]|uniref:N-acetyltransferase domain-containing protein n=1 Tax=Tetrapyrgos nigripes TaxID=182062 RepID=A0A8H5D254_9AGAR|nr:hypothetical protein D9758_009257 [Tetrapyrgos nigripes]